MGHFDRYLLTQFTALFGFFSLVLVAVYWVNRAVVLFDQLIANGESAAVFLQFMILTLPNVIRLVLPISAFAAVIYVANRLMSESELVVVQATGYSPRRLTRPALVFGVFVALLVSILTHVLMPLSTARLNDMTREVAQNATARLLTEGEFVQPVEGITLYIREITPGGELRNVYLSDRRYDNTATAYIASRALLVGSETGPSLLMFNGQAQTITRPGNRLSVTAFDDFAYDLSGLLAVAEKGRLVPDEMPTGPLLRASPEVVAETGWSEARLLYEGHNRITQALLALVAPVLGFSIMMLGGFTRFGMWRQVIGAVLALIAVKSIDNATIGPARADAALWWLPYLAPLGAMIASGVILWIAGRPRWRSAGGAA